MPNVSTRLLSRFKYLWAPLRLESLGHRLAPRAALVLCGLASCGLAQPSLADPIYSVAPLPDLGSPSGVSAAALSESGQVAGTADVPYTSAEPAHSHAFLFSSQSSSQEIIGTLGGSSSYGSDLNSQGVAAGYSYLASGPYHAFVFRNGQMLDIGALNPDFSTSFTSPNDINETGEVVGALSLRNPDGTSRSHAFLYSGGRVIDIGTLGGSSCTARDINNAGAVVGYSSLAPNSAGAQYQHAFVFRNGQMSDLVTLGGLTSSADKINDAGQIAGTSRNADNKPRAFRWSNGVMTDLGVESPLSVSVADMNEGGDILGIFLPNSTDQSARAYISLASGALVNLGTLGGSSTRCSDLNDLGHAVGFSTLADNSRRAVLFRDGRLWDLNTALPANSGWVLESASFINNAGQIVAVGLFNGQRRTCFLSPSVPPTASADTFAVRAGGGSQVLDVLANDRDPAGGTLTVVSATGATSGTLGITGGGTGVSYTPGAGFAGDSFSYTIRNARGLTAQANVTLTAAAEAPIADSRAVTIVEDTPHQILLHGSDANGDALTYRVTTPPQHGTLSVVASGDTSRLLYTPTANYNGPDAFGYKANDGALDSNEATVSITVQPVNDAPSATAQSVSTDEDGALRIVLGASDVDGDALRFSILTQPAHGTLSTLAGDGASLTYTPEPDYSGPDTVRFTATDGQASSEGTISIRVKPVNDAPVADNISLQLDEDTSAPVLLQGRDVEGSPLSYTVVSGPSHGTLSGTGAELRYTPAPNYNGPDSFTYKANDGTADSQPATASIQVKAVNDAPQAVADVATTSKGTSLVVSVLANDFDVDGDLLFFVRVTPGTQGTVSVLSNGALLYTPAKNFTGTESFTYTIRDAQGLTSTAIVTVTVTSNGRPPKRA